MSAGVGAGERWFGVHQRAPGPGAALEELGEPMWALAMRIKHRAGVRWGELVALMRAQDGLPSADDYAWADTALGIAGGSRNRPTR